MIEVRQTAEFEAWIEGLRDAKGAAQIARRLARVASGLPGDVGSVGDGVSELRIHHGPGYRLYFVQRSRSVIVLLCGGDKGTQDRDIRRAKQLAKEY
jgi:putative addiction module killer protein